MAPYLGLYHTSRLLVQATSLLVNLLATGSAQYVLAKYRRKGQGSVFSAKRPVGRVGCYNAVMSPTYYSQNRDKCLAYTKSRNYRLTNEARLRRAAGGCQVCHINNPDLLRETQGGVLCINCHRKHYIVYSANPLAKGKAGNRARLRSKLAAIKSEAGCSQCNERDPRALDFHHIDFTTKIANVSMLCKNGLPTVLVESAKCSILCANCHRLAEAASGWASMKPRQMCP